MPMLEIIERLGREPGIEMPLPHVAKRSLNNWSVA